MRAHLIQNAVHWEDKPANFRAVEALVRAADPAPGDLVLLAELFDTGFSFNLPVTADGDGATLAFVLDLARRHRVFVQGARTVLGPDGKGRNCATIASPQGALLAEYHKVHPFSFGKEHEFFSGGPGVLTYAWDAGPEPAGRAVVCPAVCYDLRFPELFRRGALMGAEVFALGANWPEARAEHRLTLARARAIENQAFVLVVNVAGRDPHLVYAGGSAAFGPKGEPLGLLGPEPGTLTVAIDPGAVRDWRGQFPALRDVRVL